MLLVEGHARWRMGLLLLFMHPSVMETLVTFSKLSRHRFKLTNVIQGAGETVLRQ